MRVLLIGDYPPPHGGVAIHVQQLHQFLRGRDIEAKVLDIGKGGRPVPDVLPVQSLAGFGLRLAGFLSAGWTVHVHTSGNNTKSWLMAAAAGAPGPRAPRVITLHSGLLPGFLAGSRARRALARAALAGYARVVAVSEAVKEALVGCGVAEEKILVLPAFCASQVKPGLLTAAVELARTRRRPLLAMAHHPSPVYGRKVMFRALRLLADEHPDVGLAVFGPGTRAPEFARDAREARVAAHLEDLGELEHDEALGLLSRCDAFIRPTTHDGDSISVREALTLGVPCVASDVCTRPEGTYLFRAGQAPELAQRILQAIAEGPAQVSSPDAGPVLLELYEALASSRLSNERPMAATY
ncbi:glycosyltransferase family 4 protein [Stigmatella aurantiaca]|uniref:Glycosyl transferase, group 1, putative n=1 Tax=Stigmatella aurantiaca (strain DW4/3-1) TaxID=378806 RepID=Q097Z9_STIAD|nr:glycosyltransferase family 4 protein [Stigmatella aurantiaca]ADO71487.1 Glycosyltransferase 1 family protein [Stigmatella aurantiaca DW4/3-1]EAU68052.1 glycosyl transferase, group 1, putative [Stigmatella aurantiaca DW4/3-1]